MQNEKIHTVEKKNRPDGKETTAVVILIVLKHGNQVLRVGLGPLLLLLHWTATSELPPSIKPKHQTGRLQRIDNLLSSDHDELEVSQPFVHSTNDCIILYTLQRHTSELIMIL